MGERGVGISRNQGQDQETHVRRSYNASIICNPTCGVTRITWRELLFAQDFVQRVEDRLDRVDLRFPSKGELDSAVDCPGLVRGLRLGDGHQHLVGGRCQVLHQEEVLAVGVCGLGEVLAVLHEGDL